MPELPEVETARRGIAPHVVGQQIRQIIVRDRRLRWPLSKRLEKQLAGQSVRALRRRGKYLVFELATTEMIVHLGMSGNLRFLVTPLPAGKHDHVDWVFTNGTLRYNDPRRFGCILLTKHADNHPLLRNLGPEPFSDSFTADYLYSTCAGRRVAIKQHLMNANIVVGVGNIYANEALFRAGIHPRRAAGRISKARLELLVEGVREVLTAAIAQGGTTLRDFVGSDGNPGYFRISLDVYERAGLACKRCDNAIKRIVLGQRATYFCAGCQR